MLGAIMTKKGFTLMELLVSIFITGMVMLSLVAMWKTSSNQTALAQRQSIIKNENTIFLRKIYSDFVSASEIICPWGYFGNNISCTDDNETTIYIAVKEAVLNPDNPNQLMRITDKCNGNWATEETLSNMANRCIAPSYVVYVFDKSAHSVYRCSNTFLSNDDKTVNIEQFKVDAEDYCSADGGHREIAMPYVSNFSLSIPDVGNSKGSELLVEYTINRDFGSGLPPYIYKFKRYLTKKRGA